MKDVYFRKFCKEIASMSNIEVEVKLSNGYYFNFNNNTIYIYRLTEQRYLTDIEKKIDCYFLESLLNLTPQDKLDIVKTAPMPILSYLHELGHKHTATIELINEYIDEETMFKNRPGDLRERQMRYFNIPIEKIASQWAVNFLIEHYDEIAVLWGKYFKGVERIE